jgi:hypothetical protein
LDACQIAKRQIRNPPPNPVIAGFSSFGPCRISAADIGDEKTGSTPNAAKATINRTTDTVQTLTDSSHITKLRLCRL